MTDSEIRSHICHVGMPIDKLRNLINAVALITETLDEPQAGAVNVIVYAALEQVAEMDTAYIALFRLSHPDRERFEREGWPGEGEPCS
jgi:hypothetical protein